MKTETFDDYQLRIDQEARAAAIAASLVRQRRAMRAWRVERWTRFGLVVAAVAFSVLVGLLAMVGFLACLGALAGGR